MKQFFLIITAILLLHCQNKKTVQLPKTIKSDTTKIKDVSAAYFFYNTNKPDSLTLNRKNLISTTNWLFHVDKRLTLEQALPKIIFLQEKKANAKMHKNDAAQNYYTSYNYKFKKTGFINFTQTHYNLNSCKPNTKTKKYTYNTKNFKPYTDPYIQKDSSILLVPLFIDKNFLIYTNNSILNQTNTKHYLQKLLENSNYKKLKILSCYSKKLNFEAYLISNLFIKSLKSDSIFISKNECIY